MPPITCHILDTTVGKPAPDVTCQLYYIGQLITDKEDETLYRNSEEEPFAMAKTDNDGRVKQWHFNPNKDLQQVGITSMQWQTLVPGNYKIKFLTGKYFHNRQARTFFPFVEIMFTIDDPPDNHYHIPLLLSNHSYSTYRGS